MVELNNLIVKASAFELVHIGEEDNRLDRRERWWENNDINDKKMCVWYLDLKRTVAKAGRGAAERKSLKE